MERKVIPFSQEALDKEIARYLDYNLQPRQLVPLQAKEIIYMLYPDDEVPPTVPYIPKHVKLVPVSQVPVSST